MLTPEQEFGGYRILEELGRGGMGIVYLAEETGLRRKVALKVITSALGSDDLFKARFEREAQHAASLDHSNIVPVFAAGANEDLLFLAMRYVDGADLASVLRANGRLDKDEAARVTADIGAALDEAHRKGLVHRDVKPANVLLQGGKVGGHVYLTDFGLTKEVASESSLTNTGQWVGTVDFVAPEQIERRTLTARTDVYALGCVLFQALAGRVPFEGTEVQKLWSHMQDEPPSLSKIDAQLGEAFDPVIARSMAKDPDERYPSAGDLGRAALAASGGSENTVNEKSVATGLAATVPGAAVPTGASSREREVTEVLPPGSGGDEPVTVRQIDSPGGRSNKTLVAMGIVTALAVGLAVAALLVSTLGQDSDPAPATEASDDTAETVTSVETETTAAQSEDPGPQARSAGSLAPATYASYSPSDADYAYSASLPEGNGWGQPVESRPTGGPLLRTTVRGPGGMFLFVDRTPTEVPQIGGGADSSREVSHPIFGTVSENIVSDSEFIPECSGAQCVDYLIDDGTGGGWGVLAGGPNLATATEVASQVTNSVAP